MPEKKTHPELQGFTQLQTYLLAIAQGAIIMTFLFSAAWLSKRYNNKLLFAFVSIPPMLHCRSIF